MRDRRGWTNGVFSTMYGSLQNLHFEPYCIYLFFVNSFMEKNPVLRETCKFEKSETELYLVETLD